MNNPMSVEQIKMTGAELKKIWKRAGRGEDDLKEYLDISKSSWYDMVNKKANEPIPDHIEARVSKDQGLSPWINLELSGPKPDQMEVVITAMQRYGDLSKSLEKMMDVVTILLTKQDSKYDDLKKNNDVIIRNNDTLTEFLNIAKKEGEFVYQKKSA